MVLSDGTIRAEIEAGRIAIDPYEPGNIQPASIDVRCDRMFRVFLSRQEHEVDHEIVSEVAVPELSVQSES